LKKKSNSSWRLPLLFATGFVLLIALIYFVSSRILLNGFYKVEEENSATNGLRLQSALKNALLTQDATTISWA